MYEAIRLFAEAVPRLDHARLVAYALDIARNSTCQRLGLLLERFGVEGPFMADLRARAAHSTSAHQLIPGAGRTAPPNPVWHVIENDEPRSGARSATPT